MNPRNKNKTKDKDNKFYTYRFRIYPNKEQIIYFNEQIGYHRFVYNFFLERTINLYENYNIKNNYHSNSAILPLLKKGFPFLKEANSQSLQGSLRALDDAYHRFFTKQAGYPNFKKKYSYNSIVIPQSFKIVNNTIQIPKLKSSIKVKFHRHFYETVNSISISKTTSGKYYVNMLIDKFKYTPYIPKKTLGISTGIDLGIKDFATITTGTNINDKQTHKIPNPTYLLKSQKKLVKLSRWLNRKVHKRTKQDKTTSSKNYLKFKNKLSLLHEHIFNQRNNFLHKLSSRIVNDNQVIILEDLNIKGMIKNRHLSKSISDVSWSRFVDMIKYKASWYGRQIIEIDRFYPSSKKCSTLNCDYVYKDLKLSKRSWTCPKCGITHDRDINASINLFLEGLIFLLEYVSKYGSNLSEFTPVEYEPAGYRNTGISRHTMKQEAHAS